VLVGFNGVLVGVMELPLTRVTGTLRPRRVMAAGFVLLGAGFACNALPGGFTRRAQAPSGCCVRFSGSRRPRRSRGLGVPPAERKHRCG